MAAHPLFRTTDYPIPPADLLGKILARIEEKKAASRTFKLRALLLASTASVTALGVALYLVAIMLARSGAPTFLKLAVTDTGTVLTYWQDFAYSLLETVPAGGLAAALVSATIVAITLRALIRVSRINRHTHILTF